MQSRASVLVVLLASVAVGDEPAQQIVRAGFEGPREVIGRPGETLEIEVYPTVWTNCDQGDAGVMGGSWALSIGADGVAVVDIGLGGLTVLDRNGEQIAVDGYNFFEFMAPRRAPSPPRETVNHLDDPDRHGAILAIGHMNYPLSIVVLAAERTHRVARLIVEVVVPPEGESRVVTFTHEDGFGLAPPGEPPRNPYRLLVATPAGFSFEEPIERVSHTITVRGREQPDFARGDANADGESNITDVVFTLRALFRGGPQPDCVRAADANDDGQVDIVDPIAQLEFLFRSAQALPAPRECGPDPTPDGLTCDGFGPCDEVWEVE